MRPRSPEPKGKLDAMTGYSFSTPVWDGRTWVRPAVGEVAVTRIANGPEDRPREQDAPAGWDKIDWRGQEGQGRRVRVRGFNAARGEHAAPGPGTQAPVRCGGGRDTRDPSAQQL